MLKNTYQKIVIICSIPFFINSCSLIKIAAFSNLPRDSYISQFVVPTENPIKIIIETNHNENIYNYNKNDNILRLYETNLNFVNDKNDISTTQSVIAINNLTEILPIPLQTLSIETKLYVDQLSKNIVLQEFDGSILIVFFVVGGFALGHNEMTGQQVNYPDLVLGKDLRKNLNYLKNYNLVLNPELNNMELSLAGLNQKSAINKLSKSKNTPYIYLGLHAPYLYLTGNGGSASLIADIVYQCNKDLQYKYRIVINQRLPNEINGFNDILNDDMKIFKDIISILENRLASCILKMFY